MMYELGEAVTFQNLSYSQERSGEFTGDIIDIYELETGEFVYVISVSGFSSFIVREYNIICA